MWVLYWIHDVVWQAQRIGELINAYRRTVLEMDAPPGATTLLSSSMTR